MKQIKYMTDKDITEFIKSYIEKSSFNYAILIDGSWGCGKTYYIKNTLIPDIKEYEKKKHGLNEGYKEKRIIYISLYGVTSREEINRQIFLEIIPLNKFFKSKSFQIAKAMMTGALSCTGIDLSGVSVDESLFMSLENCLLIFDDLERCGMDINEVLGYINNFVEHDEIKVIIVANEKDIATVNLSSNRELKYLVALNKDIHCIKDSSEKDLQEKLVNNKIEIDQLTERVGQIFGKDEIYKQIKEKLIGVTIHYRPVLSNIIDKIVSDNIEDKNLRELVIEQKDFIINKFNLEHPNIRTLLFCLDKFYAIAKFLIKSEIEANDIKNVLIDILKYTVVISIHYKNGKAFPEWKENSEIDIISLSGSVFSFDYIKGFKFIESFISEASFDEDKAIEVIKSDIALSKRKMKDPSDSLYILSNNWLYMEDVEAAELLKKVNLSLINEPEKYDITCYAEILYINILLSSMRVIPDELQNVVEAMKNNTKQFAINEHFNVFGLSKSFYEEEVAERNLYNECIKDLYDYINSSRSGDSINKVNSFLENEDDWAEKLSEYIINNRNYFYEQKKFISLLNIEKIISMLKKSDGRQITEFRGIIEEMYKASNVSEFFTADKESIDVLISKLNEHLAEIKDTRKIWANNYRHLIQDFGKIVQRL